MPDKPKHYQARRTHLRVSITLSPKAIEDLDVIREKQDLLTISGAIAWAALVARAEIERAADDAKKQHSENPEKNS